MENKLGAAIGALLDRRDGDSGIKGAIVGAVAEGVVKSLVPVAATFAIGWGVQYLARRIYRAATGEGSSEDRA